MIGKVLGLDLGEKTLGIAESDLMGIIATGVENFRFESCDFDKAMERVKFYVKRDMIKEIALGLPLHMSGDESDHSIMCREFKDRIEKEIPGVKVVHESSIVVLANVMEERIQLIAYVSKNLIPTYNAGKIIKELTAVIGGSGGGRPDVAQGGGKDASKIDEAFDLLKKGF